MSSTKVKTIFFTSQVVTTAGLEISNFLGSAGNLVSGYIKQIIIRKSAGAATTVNLQIRYLTGNSNREYLIYSDASAALPFVDSDINAPFSLIDNTTSLNMAKDLYLFIDPDADCTLEIRIDVEMYSR